MEHSLSIIGGGLAGSEAAWQAAELGIRVKLFEMRPLTMTPAHHTPLLAELVCSNSFRANNIENAVGLLKEEMRLLNSLIINCADKCAVPAGGALAVDRERFSTLVTSKIKNHPNIDLITTEVTEIPTSGTVIIATGPLTSQNFAQKIEELTGSHYLHFYDAAAPVVDGEGINTDVAFWASRYGKGTADYLNCPLNEKEYEDFYQFLLNAERNLPKDFEKDIIFEGCMPIEVMARRGRDTIRFGPLKPVGLIDPKTGKEPYAVVQLRQDNAAATLFNLVGFQTSLKWSEQKKLLALIPGLEKAEIVRFGVMHRNTYILSPELLYPTMQLKQNNDIFFAGQISGVEGYVESAASGLQAGINAARYVIGKKPLIFPKETAIGALSHYITSADSGNFQPMNITFGLLPPLAYKVKDKKKRRVEIAKRSLEILKQFKKQQLDIN
ncbi:MAG: FADH(2)-oxidizing methylenetetrahydrofolate--tRNA-(uracil(54)-C(5))-methyltransferase TrmFO [Zhaonellaceae bacterium]|jgi:methylenetetrahydrofolate--tRNA-(uracil-5-)-methyltransferase|nr:FADH(2)-oxidizing methylenetetrahydrofolate--tRNA-(uracil(54)-C(5))-methyltransferase TrmFO [Clostridia bacterium]